MASLLKSLSLFKKARDQPPTPSGAGGAIRGIKHTIIVPIPGDTTIKTRSRLLDRLLKMVSDSGTRGPKLTGVLISILSLFVESPGQLIQRITDDPDISIRLVEVIPSSKSESKLTFASRGANLDEEADSFFRRDDDNLKGSGLLGWFEETGITDVEVYDAETFTILLSSILAQIWILLAKAVTAPDTASDSETRRWVKYTQQRRVIGEFRMNKIWLDTVRNRIAEDLSLRRFMVFMILDIKRTPGNRPRIAEMICDIDNYVVEAGLASFILTIKFGIETMYPAIALHEFSGELTTIESLMHLYQQMGEMAPYMVILESSLQNKFSAGSYPLLWSYAMGIGVELEASMGGLNFGRSYFDPAYFRLGQEMVRRSAGKVSSSMAAEMGFTQEETQLVHEIATKTVDDRGGRGSGPKQSHVTFLRASDPKGEHSLEAENKNEQKAKDKNQGKSEHQRPTREHSMSDDQEEEWCDPDSDQEDQDEDGENEDQRSAEALARLKLMAVSLEKGPGKSEQPGSYNDKSLLN